MKTAELSDTLIRRRRLGLVTIIALLSLALLAVTASTQSQVGPQPTEAAQAMVGAMVDSVDKTKQGVANPTIEVSPVISPEVIAGTTYPFTNSSAVALEDMSSGTTQIVGSGLDDNASLVTNIGFDFWYDGVRFTQFSCNANGLCRLGGTAVSTSFSNGTDFASTTNAPKIGPYYDDLCTGSNGKIHFKVVGSAPNRKLVVEWQNMQITRGAGCAGVGGGTFQLWLFETTGLIEFVYGTGMIAANPVDGGYSIGLQSGAATNFASVTSTGPTVSYVAANNTQTPAITSGTAYIFTPSVPAAPTGFFATSVAPLSMTINWTDNATNEVGYAIYQSTDGVNFSFVTQTAAGATSQAISGLSPSTNYFFNIFAVTEGALSTVLSGSQTTAAAGNIVSVASGNWSNPATWGGSVPTSTDNVTIQNGHTVIIDSSNALNLTVQNGGILEFEPTTARTLTVGQSVTIDSGGTFRTAASGTQTGHVLSIGENLTNNGVLDFSTNANTAGAGITFTGSNNSTFGGTGATTDIRTLTVNKGTSIATVELNPSNLSVQGTTTDGPAMAFLTLTTGIFKISGTFTLSGRVFTAAAYSIPANTGFWLNNPNFTISGQNGSATTSGLLRVSQGTFNVGTATDNSMGFNVGSNIIVEGGVVNATGRFGVAAAATAFTYNQTGGVITVCTVGNASTTLASFDLGSSNGSVISITGGTIVVQLANTGASGPRDYRNQAGVTGTTTVTGGTVQFGNANSGAAKAFSSAGVFPNLVIDNSSAGHLVTFLAPAVFNNISRNILINAGTTLNIGNNVFLMNGTTLTNNGTLTANGASSNFVWFLTTAPVTYTGTGGVTAPMTNFAMQADQGLTIGPASSNIVVGALRIFTGSITNANKITLGNGGATTGIVQIGNTTTPTNAGTLDVPLTFNLGTGGQTASYLRTTTSRTTGPEINPTRILTSMTRDDNDPTHTLTIAGGDLTLSSAATALTLTNGRVVTGANILGLSSPTGVVTRTNGFVDGNLRKNYAAAGNKNFEVGTANGFSPVAVNITAGTFPTDFIVKATQGPHPNFLSPQYALQRYWTLTGTGVTADLTFNYLDPTDIPGTAIENNFVIHKFDGSFTTPGGTVNTAANTATIIGATGFSDWTLAQPNAPSALPATISGRITNNDGIPLGGVTVHLSGNQTDRTITDANGNYRFDNLLTENFYIVAPALPNYTFSPSQRAFSLLGNRSDATFTGIAGESTVNPLTGGDFFVRQQYLDFLGREPDRDGWLYWTAQIAVCGADEACIRQRRIDVSAAFFDSEEFQRTGSFIYRLYKAGLGRRFSFTEFSNDQPHVLDGPDLENNRNLFTEQFVARPEFMQKYQNATSAEAYVEAMLTTVWQSSGIDLTARRNALLATYALGNGINESRSLVLRQIVDSSEVRQAEYNPGFVLMEYFGYLRRDPDQGGFDFWLDVLNTREPGNYRGMVCSFITSQEYQRRFSDVVSQSNRDCGQ